ncbi:ABC transporter ATP-binding protein [Halopseudomonas pelagia]|uniref:ABC transporter ATP-binding protein n=1 Tax=Halopseudomonas pelagia TaxID=553151 RepID=A0AA91U1D3_9GAMM|nr:ABC transporter ATP-binding protein [Halopseudomonas pelagia]PCC98737.1 ABC transporter ATP-binding protein [Halopseudomonas pelagia]QFY58772.1 ABC transporter ATP-binding protein [Halopseudomonas pelagia]
MSDIHLSYPTESGTVAVLNNASLTIPPGETLAITGPSGSGKTSLLLLLSGLERPDQGEILVGSRRLGDMDSNALADWRSEHLGIIFQSFHLLPGLSALGNVSLPLEIAGQAHARERSTAMLEAVGLSHRLQHYPTQLSGGEQQRVAIARALVHQPSLLLGDEPTGNLDHKTGEKILTLLFDLHKESKSTLVLVTHDERVAERCQHRVRMDAGRLHAL